MTDLVAGILLGLLAVSLVFFGIQVRKLWQISRWWNKTYPRDRSDTPDR
jgi:hypothetical protein